MPEKFGPKPQEPQNLVTDNQRTEKEGNEEVERVGIFAPFRRFFDWLKNNRKQQEKACEQALELLDKKFARLNDFQLSVKQINNEFGHRFGISCDEAYLPKVIITDREQAFYSPNVDVTTDGGERINGNVIGLTGIEGLEDGGTLSEELAHFYRMSMKPKDEKQEYMTDEFFGYLGSMLFAKAVTDGSTVLAEIAGDKRQPLPKDKTLEFSKKRKKELTGHQLQVKKIKELFGNDAQKQFEKITKNINEDLKKKNEPQIGDFGDIEKTLKISRLEALAHQRGYEWASKVDMDKVTDWKKLFSMPNAEVRRRFFTDKPDYSGI